MKPSELKDGPTGSRKHPVDVLVVEDNAGDAFLISLIAADSPVPIKIRIAQDGIEAMFKVAERNPDLVILDLNLPDVSGHDVLRHYHPVDVPIVVFSSSDSDAEKRQSLAEGACEFVHKPNSIEEYGRAVLGMIQKWTCHKDGLAPA
jgi:chemotaxis family two-component system response regulator Rcp1